MPRKSILILDDDKKRFMYIVCRFTGMEVVKVRSIEGLQAKVARRRFDIFSLDYDLDKTYPEVDKKVRPTGESAVQRIAGAYLARGWDPPEDVIIHSVNPYGAALMTRELANSGFPKFEYRPYCTATSPTFAAELVSQHLDYCTAMGIS